jgi:hypothetical protein
MSASAGAPVRREVRRPEVTIAKEAELSFAAGAPHKGVFLGCLSRMKGNFHVRF